MRADFDEAYAELSPGKVLLRRVLRARCADATLHEYNTSGDYLLGMTWP